jgi:hypothetical protein
MGVGHLRSVVTKPLTIVRIYDIGYTWTRQRCESLGLWSARLARNVNAEDEPEDYMRMAFSSSLPRCALERLCDKA